jgi:hypothetical protein
MTNEKQIKEFDCIAMKREAQDRIYLETKDMSSEQQIQYFRNAVENSRFRNWWRNAVPIAGNRANQAS